MWGITIILFDLLLNGSRVFLQQQQQQQQQNQRIILFTMMNVDCMQANLIYAQIVKTGIKLNAAMVYNASTCGTCAMEKVIAGIPAMKTVAVQVTSRSRVCLTCVARLLIAGRSRLTDLRCKQMPRRTRQRTKISAVIMTWGWVRKKVYL
jgi:hypothetical protein